MAAGNFGSPLQLIVLLAIVLLLFGGNRLKNLGGDLGSAIKGFKKAMDSDKQEPAPLLSQDHAHQQKLNEQSSQKNHSS